MAGETETIRYVMTVDGSQQTAASFENTAKSIKKSDDALKAASATAKTVPTAFAQSAKAANDNAQAFTGLATSTQKVLPAFSALGSAVSGLIPEFGGMASAVGRAGGAMAGMTAVIGGTAGLAAGGLVAGLGLLSEAMKYVASDAERMNRQLEASGAIMTTTRAALMRSQTDAQRAARAARDRAIAGNFFDPNAPTDSAMQKSALDALNQYEKENEWRIGNNIEPGKAQPGGGFGYRSQDDIQAQLRRLDAMANKPTLDQRAEAGKSAIQAKRDEAEAQQRQFEEHARDRAKILDQETKRFSELGEVGGEAYGIIASNAATALSAISRGQKVTLKEVMASIGSELVGKGVMWGFEGGAKLASSYGTDPAGWELLGIGAAAVAAGMGMGALASSGSGNRGSVSRPRASATDPAWQTDTVGGRSQPTYNIYQSNMVGDARAGQEVVKAIQEAQRQGLVTGNGMAA